METAIKIYKELSYITCYDEQIYTTSMTVEELKTMINKKEAKFLELWSKLLIAISSIKRIESRPADDLDNRIIQIQNQDLKEKVRAEVRKRKAENKEINLTILENIIERVSKEMKI